MSKNKPKKLTKLVIDALKVPEDKDRIRVFDTVVAGFAVVRFASGRTSFQYVYGPRHRRRAYVIGQYGPWTVQAARDRAKALAVSVNRGIDPMDEKRKGADDKRLTFRLWAAEYVGLIRDTKRTWKRDETYLRWAADSIGGAPLSSVTMADVQRLALKARSKGIGESPRWKDANHNATANRFLSALSGCFSMAVKRQRIPFNPARGVDPFPENPPRQRVLSDDELVRVLKSVAGLRDPFARAAFTLLLETGARTSEVLRARWEDVDLDGKVWRIPRPKSGREGEAIGLPDSTVAMLRNLPHIEGSPWIIPGAKPENHRYELREHWQAVQKAANVPDVHLHDLRRTFGLALARRAGIHVASRVLRHSNVSITAKVYAPLGVEELRSAMDKVSEDRGKLLKFAKDGSK